MSKILDLIENASVSAQSLDEVVKLHTIEQPNSTALQSLYNHFLKRTYEDGLKWFYIVFKPFNDSYNIITYSDCISKTSDHLKNKFKCDLGILSREMMSDKIHVNALVVGNQMLYDKHGSNVQCRGLKYKLHVQQLDSYSDRFNVLRYIFKEADERDFYLYQDHRFFETKRTYHQGPRDSYIYEVVREPVTASSAIDPNECDPDEPINLRLRLF